MVEIKKQWKQIKGKRNGKGKQMVKVNKRLT